LVVESGLELCWCAGPGPAVLLPAPGSPSACCCCATTEATVPAVTDPDHRLELGEVAAGPAATADCAAAADGRSGYPGGAFPECWC
jgi:hypothetical protein